MWLQMRTVPNHEMRTIANLKKVQFCREQGLNLTKKKSATQDGWTHLMSQSWCCCDPWHPQHSHNGSQSTRWVHQVSAVASVHGLLLFFEVFHGLDCHHGFQCIMWPFGHTAHLCECLCPLCVDCCVCCLIVVVVLVLCWLLLALWGIPRPLPAGRGAAFDGNPLFWQLEFVFDGWNASVVCVLNGEFQAQH